MIWFLEGTFDSTLHIITNRVSKTKQKQCLQRKTTKRNEIKHLTAFYIWYKMKHKKRSVNRYNVTRLLLYEHRVK